MKILNKVNMPSDLKKLNINELNTLSSEIREFLIENVSKTGGHLGSNLGVVELTIALHYALNSPKNKIVFDVGHQSYTHKILTNRKNMFQKLRQYKGLSGFPKTAESEHDAFNTGHSTTSISAGLGIATANKQKGINDKVYAIIGDGALTGGMAYEALNNAGRMASNLVVILNDNEMSISKNVGALSKSLSNVRISKDYIVVKEKTEKILKNIPLGSDFTINRISKVKKSLRKLVGDGVGNFFEDLGIRYYGVIDGHNIKALVSAIENIESVDGPVVLHIKTKKGKGYKVAETFPERYHGVGKFDISTGEQQKKDGDDYSKVFGKAILNLALKNTNIVGITAAMAGGTGMQDFSEKIPERFYDVGIAEQHAITFAGGLAIEGFIPVVPIYSSFLQRAYDQLIHDIALQNLHVVVGIDRSGLVGEDGETHQGIFDISYMLTIPNMCILSPFTREEMVIAVKYAIEDLKCPVAIRYPRGLVPKDISGYKNLEKPKPFEVFEGEKTCIVAVGNFMNFALEVRSIKETVGVINPFVLTDFDEILALSKKYENIIVLEDGIKRNGFGASLILKAYENNISFKNFKVYGYEDYVEQGSVKELYEHCGITTENIIKEIEKFG